MLDDTLRRINDFLKNVDERERADKKRAEAIAEGLGEIAREIREGFTRLEHTVIDGRR